MGGERNAKVRNGTTKSAPHLGSVVRPLKGTPKASGVVALHYYVIGGSHMTSTNFRDFLSPSLSAKSIQGSAKELFLGCVIPASWLPFATRARLTQPRDADVIYGISVPIPYSYLQR